MSHLGVGQRLVVLLRGRSVGVVQRRGDVFQQGRRVGHDVVLKGTQPPGVIRAI